LCPIRIRFGDAAPLVSDRAHDADKVVSIDGASTMRNAGIECAGCNSPDLIYITERGHRWLEDGRGVFSIFIEAKWRVEISDAVRESRNFLVDERAV
jgi:hypothetical protein